MAEKSIKIKHGGLWEFREWEIVENCIVSYADIKPCKHCKKTEPEKRTTYEGKPYEIKRWICPKAIIGKNEGGYNSVGICADCISEALKEH